MHTLLITTLICLLVYLTIYSTKFRYVKPFSYVAKSWCLYYSRKLEIYFAIDRENNYGLGWIFHRGIIYHEEDDTHRILKEHTLYFYKVNIIVKIYE